MFKQSYFYLRFQARKCSTRVQTKAKPIVSLDGVINEMIKKDELKPRKHEGRVHKPAIGLPKWIIKAMNCAMEGYAKDAVLKDASDLHRYLIARSPPPEKDVVGSKYTKLCEEMKEKLEYPAINPSNDEISPEIHNNAMKLLKLKVVPWAAIQYDTYRGLMYMLARGAQDYAILHKIIGEIQSRDQKFKPITLLDFGSGIGTVSWVATELWEESLKERICIDISTEMNNLAEKIMSGADRKIKSTAFYRQYLPIASVPTFDIVVSAFSLMELPGRKIRLDTIASLWKKTNKYLVLIECGTRGGFEVISEARDFVLHLIDIQKAKDPSKNGFVLAPCPHDFGCPKKASANNNVCKFETKFFQTSLGTRIISRTERYSYVIFKRDAERGEKDSWPRIVQPVLEGSGRAICRMCTGAGKLQEVIFTKAKHERPLFYCARSSCLGDRLPITIDPPREE